ncbi:MAG: ATP-dependent DNA helicase RecQ, partial [Planctomycetales bacterium]|nr:ATP-dependent DNA helicase RecQ [Planctomycetales bacterium]
VSPLIALMKDQVDQLQQMGIAASFINSSLSMAEASDRMDRMVADDFDLMYIAPERFRSPRFMEALHQTNVQLLAIDEAHCISEWGHDFRHDYTRLGKFRQQMGHPQTIALTATATSDVRDDVIKQLEVESPQVFIAGFARPNLNYQVEPYVSAFEKREALVEYLNKTAGTGIIYASTRKGCDEIAEQISEETN